MPEVSVLSLQNKIIGALLQGARLKRGRTQKECADALGVSPAIIAAYEEGRRAISLPEVELLAYFLHVPLMQFFSDGDQLVEPDPMPPPQQLVALRQRIIAVQLQEARAKAGKSLNDLATVLGCSSRVVSKYEKGEQPIPLAHLELLADHLGVPMTHFLDEGIGTVGEREMNDRLYEQFRELPDEVQQFVTQPVNRLYLQVAMRLASMPTAQLRGIAEGILEITY
jgi:transcriptional regulator with XRE-family HTH domain